MRTYVINLRRRPDRRARMQSRLPPDLDVTFTSDWDGPLDGADIDAAALTGFGLFPWQIESENPWWSRPLKKGEIGCAVSHWRCWNDAWDRADDEVLILEDDVRLADGFVERLSLILERVRRRDAGWQLIYLGRLRTMQDRPIGEGLVRPGFSLCTYAYMLSRSGVRALLSTRFSEDLIPADEFLAASYFLHPRADVRARYPPLLNAFALEQDIAFQSAAEGDSDTERTAFVDT